MTLPLHFRDVPPAFGHLTSRAFIVALVSGAALLCAAPIRAQSPTNPASALSLPVAMLRGTVTDSANRPIAQALVQAVDPSGRAQTVRTDAAGAFALALPGAGRYAVDARAVGYRAGTRDVRWQGVASTPLTIVLQTSRVLAPVQVIGAVASTSSLHPSASDLAGSVTVLSGEQIAREQVSFAQELLRKVPGVYRSEFNQGIVSGDIGVRGFNTESEIASTKLLVDGIPSNLNSGVSEMNALFPLEIERMDVVRGTNDPRFGLFNLAGNVSIGTRQGGNYVTSRLQSGSFGTQDAQVLGGIERAGFSQTLFGGIRRSDGYRDNSNLDKWSASGKWFYASPAQRVRVGVIARTHRLEAKAPGYLSLAESRATPTLSPAYSLSDGGTIASDHGSVHLDVRQTATLTWSLKGYSQHFERVRYVRFTAAGAQQERIEDERQTGAIATMTWKPTSLARYGVLLTGGADVQHQANIQQRYRTLDRTRQATLRDYTFSLDNTGGFIQLVGAPIDRLQLTAGVRADRFGGDFTNIVTQTTLPIVAYGTIAQPKVSATLRISDQLTSYANFGRAFQIGAGIASYGRTPLNASTNDGYEVGVVSAPTDQLSVRAGFWQQKASDEVRLKFDNSGDSENIGRTRRSGIDVESTLRLPKSVSIWAAGTSQRAILVEPGLTNPTAKGKRLDHVPSWTLKYGADWSPVVGAHLSFWSYSQGKYDLTQQNNRGTWGDIRTVNADVSWRWRAAALGVGATNLFDRYSEYVFFDGTQTLHSPAAKRALFVTLTLDR